MKRKGNILLYPLSLIYGVITSFRNFLYNSSVLKSVEFDIPVICVGNITVGGTGKTPHCEYIINLLHCEFRVAFLSRGYKRKSKGFVIAEDHMNASDIGDEAFQIFRKFPGITVAVDSDRTRGIRLILEKNPKTQVIILDDGFQHRKVTPGFTVLLTDYSRLMIHDHMLPYGDLRESASNMSRADIILITKAPPDITPIQRRIIVKDMNKAPWQNLYFTSVVQLEPQPVFPSDHRREISLTEEYKHETGIALVTGIARSELFTEHFSKFASDIIHLSFADHHMFTSEDIDAISGSFARLQKSRKYIITTEKDAVRILEFTNIAEPERSSFYYIPSGIYFLNDDTAEFNNLITDYVRKNKRNRKFSQEKRI